MTNDSSQSDSALPDASVHLTADPELEQLLDDACAAPPVPRSLLQRIDRGVQQEWGVSPRLAENRSHRLARSVSNRAQSVGRGMRRLRVLPVAASLSLLILLGVIFNSNTGGYAWADMLEALAERDLVQINSPDGVRWLSLSEGVVAERTAEVSRLVDVKQQVVLHRARQELTIQRYRISPEGAPIEQSRLVVGFLLGGAALASDPQQLQGLTLVEESWERNRSADREEIALRTRFESDAGPVVLRLQLDPVSRLPLTCQVVEGHVATDTLPVSFPASDVAALQEQEFPPELTIVDVAAPVPSAVAALSTFDTPAVDTVVPIPDEETLTTTTTTTTATTTRDEPQPEAEATSTLLAATTRWSPVVVSEVNDVTVLQQVNDTLEQLWQENDVQPAPAADDEELLRRVYLDLAGRTPSVNEVRAYLKDESADRYEQLVDRLLASPDHASHLATVWRTFLIPEGIDLAAFGGVSSFDRWLAGRFASNEPYDELVRSLLLAEGRLSKSGPLLFYSAVKLDPDQLAARTSRVFLGMRLECAQCHDHPFEPWTQEDFWSYAAFFARISRPRGELENVSTVMRVRDIDRGDVTLPYTDTVVEPRFLDGRPAEQGDQAAARRQQLAEWLTSASNPYFARAAANRIWGQLFGKGIIDPVDDFGLQHPPTSPELLDLLAGHFIQTGFDLRELFRTVALSKAYRLSSGAPTADERRLELFAQMNVKTLSAEQVYDCISVATMLESAPAANPYDFNLLRFGNTDRDLFLQQFRTPAGRRTEYQGGIPQALTLMNGRLIDNATGLSSSGLLSSLEAPFFTNRQRIEVLYLATLSRRPRESEWELLEAYVPDDATGIPLKEGLSDLLWALLNSAEFTLNH